MMLPVWANAQEKTPCACMVNNIGHTCPVNMTQISLILLTNDFRLPLRNQLCGWLRWLRQSGLRLSGELICWLNGSVLSCRNFFAEEENYIEASCRASNLWPSHVNPEVESRSPQETGDVTQMYEKDGIKDKILSKNDLDHSLLLRELSKIW